jgi:hypothetical protein
MVGQPALFVLVAGIIVNDQLDRVEHRDPSLGTRVQVVAQTVFEHADVDPLIGLRYADALGKQANRFRRVPAPTQAHQGRHPRIVPSIDVPALHQLEQLALAHHRVQKVEPCKFVLLRQRSLQEPGVGKSLDHPVVERPMVLELERAQRVCDALQRVRNAMRVIVERIYAPLVAGTVMSNMTDAIDRRIAQVDVRARQIDLESQHVRAIRNSPSFLAKSIEVSRPSDRGTGCAPDWHAAKMAHLFGRRAVDVGQARLDQVARKLVQTIEIVGGVIEMGAPIESQPSHRGLDRILVLDVLLDRVGIIESQVTNAAVFSGEAKVQADGFGVSNV